MVTRGANNQSDGNALSFDGRYAAYNSLASNLVDGDTNAKMDVFLQDLQESDATPTPTPVVTPTPDPDGSPTPSATPFPVPGSPGEAGLLIDANLNLIKAIKAEKADSANQLVGILEALLQTRGLSEEQTKLLTAAQNILTKVSKLTQKKVSKKTKRKIKKAEKQLKKALASASTGLKAV